LAARAPSGRTPAGGGALPVRPRSSSLVARQRARARQASGRPLRAFGRRRLLLSSRRRNDRLWPASGYCPRLDQGSTARPPGGPSSRASEGSPAAFDHGLDPKPPIASSTATGRWPRSAARPPACPRLRSGAKLSPGLAPTLPGLLQAHPIEGQETGRERLLLLIERTFARI